MARTDTFKAHLRDFDLDELQDIQEAVQAAIRVRVDEKLQRLTEEKSRLQRIGGTTTGRPGRRARGPTSGPATGLTAHHSPA